MTTFTPSELEPGVYSTAQAARRLGVTERTLQRWVKDGVAPIDPLPIPGRMRWSIAIVERFVSGDLEVSA